MFTGLVSDIGRIVSITPRAQGLLHRLRIDCSYDPDSFLIGASIACSGICMTAVEKGRDDDGQAWFAVDAAAETLRLTTVGRWRNGDRVNLERSLTLGAELGGHIVLGHGDGIARIVSRENLPDMAKFVLEAPEELAKFIAQKGSVALDGVSLTVNEVAGRTFSVLIIPHTLEVTTLGGWQAGTEVNIEVDLMARYAARLIETRPAV